MAATGQCSARIPRDWGVTSWRKPSRPMSRRSESDCPSSGPNPPSTSGSRAPTRIWTVRAPLTCSRSTVSRPSWKLSTSRLLAASGRRHDRPSRSVVHHLAARSKSVGDADGAPRPSQRIGTAESAVEGERSLRVLCDLTARRTDQTEWSLRRQRLPSCGPSASACTMLRGGSPSSCGWLDACWLAARNARAVGGSPCPHRTPQP